ncbi:MAG: hypothetical protein NTZ78_15205, partial [Candidatus Aureabacteria bacterium]|nr:hypothetical protein [Candidatus Auribacterota bacterium]
PWQLAREKRSDIPKEALMLPPVDLDVLLHNKLANPTLGGYYVYSSPSSHPPYACSHHLTNFSEFFEFFSNRA